MKRFLKTTAITAVLSLSLGTQLSAHAANISLGVLSGTTPFNTATSNGSFQDLYNFSVTPNAGAILASTSVSFSTYGAVVNSLSLYLGNYMTSADLAGKTALSSVSSSTSTDLGGGMSSHTVTAATYSLAPGNTYTLVITGSSKGASAYGSLIALAPVPEPETYALLLAGLGMMGFIASRRARR